MLADCIRDTIYDAVSADEYCQSHLYVFKLDKDVLICKAAVVFDSKTRTTGWAKSYAKQSDIQQRLGETEELQPCFNNPFIHVEYAEGQIIVSDNIVNQDDYPYAEFTFADPSFTIEAVIKNALIRTKYLKRGYTDLIT